MLQFALLDEPFARLLRANPGFAGIAALPDGGYMSLRA
jgi:hypothetical protein